MRRAVEFFVDRTMYGDGYTPPRGVYGDLDRAVRTDLLFHYSTPVCAQRWLDVCEDPAYGHRALLDGVSEVMPGVAEAVRADSGDRRRLTLLSLGPGDGSVDERMLLGLAATLEPVSYVGLDFSFELLRRAIHRLVRTPGLPAGLALTAVCGDFTGLGSLPVRAADADAVRLFALTGFTFGNYDEGALLRSIGALMSEGDYLFLDARLHSFGPLPADRGPLGLGRGGPLASYDLETVRRFVFGPVEVATTATASDVEFGFEPGRRVTAVPHALNLVIYCAGLDTTSRLTGERIRRGRLDLAVTTSYHLPALASWLAESGLAPVWAQQSGDVAFFLLRR